MPYCRTTAGSAVEHSRAPDAPSRPALDQGMPTDMPAVGSIIKIAYEETFDHGYKVTSNFTGQVTGQTADQFMVLFFGEGPDAAQRCCCQ